jgi:LTXXQ motif family protein
MARNRHAALLISASLAALLCATSEGAARGGGHFGGGGRFEGRRDFRPEERRPEEMRREDRRPAEDARRGEEHRDDADRHDEADRHEDRDRLDADHRDDAARREFANRDLHNPVDNRNWNHNQFWNNQFGGHAFACNNCRWGWAAGVFWPFALGDVFSYAWWPNAGPPAFWDYGMNVILTGLFWPNGVYQWPDGYGAYAWSDDTSNYQVAREAHQNVYSSGPANEPPPQAAAETTTDVAQSCSGLAPGVGALPMDKIEQAVKPEQSQRTAFNELKAASTQAETILKGACPSEAPLTPVGRLDALEKRLQAMDQAVDTLQPPLASFSKTLDDKQRQALDAMGGSNPSSSADPMQMSDIGGCADEGQQFTDVPVQQIEQSVKPDARQKTALDQLKSASTQAAQKLRLSCPKSAAATPEARFEAMNRRLRDTIAAVGEVRPALVGFYDSLSDEQKARFDTLPPQQAAQSR